MAAAAVQTAPATATADPFDFDFDPVELKKRYLEERDKRSRGDGFSQYFIIGEPGTKGEKYSHWLVDPWTPKVEREPIKEEVTVLMLGAGFSGIMSAAMLKEKGITDVRIIDGAGGFGGTWYWNRYPGAACDSESYCYLPLLEETGYVPRMRYCGAPEIAEHVARIAKKWDLDSHALFHTQAQTFNWDDARRRWICKTDRGDEIVAQFLIVGSGPLNRPKLPDVPGIETFKGHEFHTARWDYNYTGGDWAGNLHKLHDKTVAIIGTGATAVQSVPALAEHSKELYVFQRTPSTVNVRDNHPTDEAWIKSLKPGWQRERDRAFMMSPTGAVPTIDLDDGFTRTFLNLSLLNRLAAEGHPKAKDYSPAELMQLADFRHMEAIRRRVDEVVKDKETAEKLKPWYNVLCKRPGFHDEYLPSFNRPTVHLVDTSVHKGIERITETGIVVGGKEYGPFDCIVWATGFETHGAALVNKPDYKLLGRGGLDREDKFKTGWKTMYGVCTHDFPNMFFYGIPQAGATLNWTSLTNSQVDFVAYVISEAIKRGAEVIEVTKEAEDAWTKEVIDKSMFSLEWSRMCTSGYYNDENKDLLVQNTAYSPGCLAYRDILDENMKEDKLRGFELTMK